MADRSSNQDTNTDSKGSFHRKPDIINLSGQPLKINFDIKGMKKLVFLPDYSPGRGKLPVGTVAIYDKDTHEARPEYIGPDIGCGMLLARFNKQPLDNLDFVAYSTASRLMNTTSQLGSLGGGNHFINFYEVSESKESNLNEGDNLVLIHTGSRNQGLKVFGSRNTGGEYIEGHNKALEYAKRNRKILLKTVQEEAKNGTTIITDIIHNYVEITNDSIVYRKGAMKLSEGDIGVIPSSMSGEAILVRANPLLSELEWSINHGTGRKISRSEARKNPFDSSDIRREVYIPHFISDDSLRTDRPNCYRTISDIESLIKPYVDIVAKLKPKSFVK